MDDMPDIVASLVDEIKSLKAVVDELSGAKSEQNQSKRKERKMLRTPDLCFMLGKAPVTIYRMVRRGQIKAYKNGKELFFFEDDVVRMIESGKI